MTNLRWGILMSSCICALLIPVNAEASTVTVGSPLTIAANGTATCGGPCTWANTALAESGASLTSPISGVIVRWRIAPGYMGGPFTLRVLRPAGGGLYTGSGTSTPGQPVGSAINTFPTGLPVQAGDLIGLNLMIGSGIPRSSTAPGSTESAWNPALADGSTGAPTGNFPGFELLFNADVESDADHDGFGDDTQDKCVGTPGQTNGCPNEVSSVSGAQVGRKPQIELTVTVPGAGTLQAGDASDATVASASSVKLTPATQTLTSTSPQQVTLTLGLTKTAKKKLKKKGKLSVQVKVVYTPPGGTAGSPQVSQVKLKGKKKRKR